MFSRKVLLFLLLFLLPSQLAIHFWPPFSFVAGIRVDYLAPTIYATDLLVLLYVLLSFWENPPQLSGKKFWYPFTFFVLFAAANILISQNAAAAFLKWLKIAELLIFSIAVAGTKIDEVISTLIIVVPLSIIFFVILGFMQTILGHTIGGVFYFLGERSFTIQTTGIALYKIFGQLFLRPYSTFPHPNVFAAYLFSAGALVFLVTKKKTLLIKTALLFSFLALVLSGSLGAGLGALAFLGSYFLKKQKALGTFFQKTLVPLSVVMTFLLLTFSLTLRTDGLSEPIRERLLLAKASGLLWKETPLLGLGLNNFIISLPRQAIYDNLLWHLQPVHNIFLLTLSETGIFGLLILTFFLHQTMLKKTELIPLLFFVITTGLFDHYWLTLQQTQLLLAFVIGLIFSLQKQKRP